MAAVHMFIWRVGRGQVLSAGAHMATDPMAFRSDPRVRFAKALGTSAGRTFTLRDADTRQWATLVSLNEGCDSADVGMLQPVIAWRKLCHEFLHVSMTPLISRGSWGGKRPFATDGDDAKAHEGPVAAITRARVKARFWRRFNSEVPPVATDLHATDGLLASIGIGEYPIGLQGTFSIWRDSQALNTFAYRAAAHNRAIDLTRELGWYAEEMFTRFRIDSCEGTWHGVNPLH